MKSPQQRKHFYHKLIVNTPGGGAEYNMARTRTINLTSTADFLRSRPQLPKETTHSLDSSAPNNARGVVRRHADLGPTPRLRGYKPSLAGLAGEGLRNFGRRHKNDKANSPQCGSHRAHFPSSGRETFLQYHVKLQLTSFFITLCSRQSQQNFITQKIARRLK